MPEIAREQTVSTLSTRNRAKRLREIWEAAKAEDWRRKVLVVFEEEKKRMQEKQEYRKKQLERVAHLVESRTRYRQLSGKIYSQVEEKLGKPKAEKIANLPTNRIWNVLGYRWQKTSRASLELFCERKSRHNKQVLQQPMQQPMQNPMQKMQMQW